MLDLRLLGQFGARLDDGPVTIPSRPAQSLLAYLALTAGTTHRREKLAGLLWPDAEEESARGSLRQGLWRIRKALEVRLPAGVQYLLADDLTVAFNPMSPYWLDVAVLDRSPDGMASLDRLKEALAVYRGELLPGFYDEWVLRERERLEGVFERKMNDLLDRLVEEQQRPEVLEWAERWIAVGQVPEPAYRALMLAHSERGDRARIASVYQRCRQLLFEELGAQPSEQTRELFLRLSRGERVLTAAPAAHARMQHGQRDSTEPPAAGVPPFPGLQYFDIGDAERFFGREWIVARIAGRLRNERLLAVVGASGSGKSSVVRAGLVPALQAGNSLADGTYPPDWSTAWSVHVVTPTARPLEALATSLADSPTSSARLLETLGRDPRSLLLHLRQTLPQGGRALIVVDQLEELFTLCRDPFEREAFADNLLAAAEDPDGPTGIVLALRADFYAHCAQHADLREAVAQHQEYLGPMSTEELRRAIEEPARRGGWECEPGLVDLLLRDVGEEPGALPLLSHALLETWRRRRGRRLTLSGYAEAGGVRGAIARTAEVVFNERLSPDQQAIARRILLRLTELGEGTQDTRRRATLQELVTGADTSEDVQRVVHVLADARLLTLGGETAEVAHEALIREWPTLRGWLNEDRAGLRLHRGITESTAEWERHAEDPDLLYRGARLAQAREWAETHPADLNARERAFVDAAVRFAEREAAEREA